MKLHLLLAALLAGIQTGDTATILVSTTADSGPGSLRQAILDANADPNPDEIDFAIGTGVATIRPLSPLPDIRTEVVIYGRSQPGYAGTPIIELDGKFAGPGADGLSLVQGAGNSQVKGLAIFNFDANGIKLTNVSHVLIVGCHLGTDSTGVAFGSGNRRGLFIGSSSANLVGGDATDNPNVISGNRAEGILSVGNGSVNNLIALNRIGTGPDGTFVLGNAGDGVRFSGGAGASSVRGNRIAHNGGAGVNVLLGRLNVIQTNSIHGNSGLGIDLQGDGSTANDSSDADSGANDLQNYPLLSGAGRASDHIDIGGVLPGAPGTSFSLEFFWSETCHSSGFGEGRTFIGAAGATTDGTGTALFRLRFATAVPAGAVVTATATDPGGNTSEFSPCTTVTNLSLSLVTAGSMDGQTIGLRFSERLTKQSAENPMNYTVIDPDGGINVTNAKLRADGTSVILSLGERPCPPTNFHCTASNLVDLDGNKGGGTVQGVVLGLIPMDVGNPSPPSHVFTTESDSFEMVAGGSEFWGNDFRIEDAFAFVYRQVNGDFDVRTRLGGLAPMETWDVIATESLAGLMARETTNTNSKAVALLAGAPVMTEGFIRRNTGGSSEDWNTSLPPHGLFPGDWLRLKRVGDVFASYYSSNGKDWTRSGQVDTTGNPFQRGLLLGFAAAATSPKETTALQFTDFSYLPPVALFPPTPNCPSNVVELSCGTDAVVRYHLNAIAHCRSNVTLICDPPDGSVFSIGTHSVQCTALDDCGQTAQCSFTVTVLVDTTPPVITCPSNLTIMATSSEGASAGFSASATDAHDPNPTLGCLPVAGSTFPIGPTEVVCTGTDACGNKSICRFVVTVTPFPVACLDIQCPSNRVVDCQGPDGTQIDYPLPTGTNHCATEPLSWTCFPPSGVFPPGPTTVKCWGSIIENGEAAYCEFTVTVIPNCPPRCLAIQCPTNRVVPCESPRGTVVGYSFIATNLCSPNMSSFCSPPSGSVFPSGLTEVTCTASGNGQTNQCTFTVTVAGDCAPRLTIGSPSRNKFVISWPASADRLILQEAAGLPPAPGPPGWSDSSEQVARVGDLKQATIVVGAAAQKYYRLFDPLPQDAVFVEQHVETSMRAGGQYTVSITMSNSGGTTWYQRDPDGFSHVLVSENPQDNTVWQALDRPGPIRVELPDSSVPPRGIARFRFTVIAPSVPNVYNFQWRMGQLGVEPFSFGAFTDNVRVRVHPEFTRLGEGTFLADKPVVAKNRDGRLEVFAIGLQQQILHLWQNRPNGPYSGWQELPGTRPLFPAPPGLAVGLNQDGRLEVFGWTTSLRYAHAWQQSAGGSLWSSLDIFDRVLDPHFSSAPAVGVNADGRLEIFGVDGDRHDLSHSAQVYPNGPTGWGTWNGLEGTLVGNPAAIRDLDGKLHVFARWTDGWIRHIAQTAPNGGWTGWESVGLVAGEDPSVGLNPDGRLVVFVRGGSTPGDPGLYQKTQITGSPWPLTWFPLRGALRGKPAIARNVDGTLDAVATMTDGSVQHIAQDAATRSWPVGWEPLSEAEAATSEPAVGQNRAETLEVFVRGHGAELWHRKQILPGVWR